MANGEHVSNILQVVEMYIDERLKAETAGVAAELEAANTNRALLQHELDVTKLRVEATSAERDELSGKLGEANTRVIDLTTALNQAREYIRELEGTDPEPEGPLPTLLGASPLTGELTVRGVSNVTSRFGSGTAVRLFAKDSSGWVQSPELLDAGRLVLSWKPDLSRPIDEVACRAALSTAPAGSKVCVWHEPDKKIIEGGNPTQFKARAREFYNIVKEHFPHLDVVAILTGWTFHPTVNRNPLDYIELDSFDVLGLDLDGLYGPQDYLPNIAKAQKWMIEHGVERYTIAEYGVKVRTSPSYTAAQREKWLTTQTAAIMALEWKPEEICLFEASVYPEYTLGDAERAAYRAQIEKVNGK